VRAKLLVTGLCLAFCPSLASAEVVKVTVANRVTVANGQAFGTIGPYERITGSIEFALDPKDPHDRYDYISKLRTAAQGLVRGRYLLDEGIENVIKRGQAQWELLAGRDATWSR